MVLGVPATPLQGVPPFTTSDCSEKRNAAGGHPCPAAAMCVETHPRAGPTLILSATRGRTFLADSNQAASFLPRDMGTTAGTEVRQASRNDSKTCMSRAEAVSFSGCHWTARQNQCSSVL